MKTPLIQSPSADMSKPQEVAKEPPTGAQRACALLKTSDIRSDRWRASAEAIGGVIVLFGLLFMSLLFTPD